MDKLDPKQLINLFDDLAKQKNLNRNEITSYLEEVFIKAFQRDRNFNTENPIPEASVDAKVDLDKAQFDIWITYEVVEEVELDNRLIHIAFDDAKVLEAGLKIGDKYVNHIDFNDVNYSRLVHIKQLFLQKLREAEKHKLYDKFISQKGKLLTAKVIQVNQEKGYIILDKGGVSIFVPGSELSPNDHFVVGDIAKVYVLEIEKEARDAQIIGSRSNVKFIQALIEEEIDDVIDGIVKVEAISREVGFKTKVAVSSILPEVDPVGSIIGVKGQKIKPIIDELNGERIDIIKYSTDIEEYIAEAVLPAKITGVIIKEEENEGRRDAIVIVAENEFLPTLGKRGINVKLAAILTKTKLDIKTVSDAKKQGIEYNDYIKPAKFNKRKQEAFNFNTFSDETEEEVPISFDDDIDIDFGNGELEQSYSDKMVSNIAEETADQAENKSAEDENDYEEEYGDKKY